MLNLIPQTEYQNRRNLLFSQMPPNSIAIVPAAPTKKRGRDLGYPYRPDSDFYYLSGFNEPDAVLVLIPNRQQGQYIMFCRENDTQRELWEGARAGLKGAVTNFGADEAFAINDIDEILPNLIADKIYIWYAIGSNLEFDNKLFSLINPFKESSYLGASPSSYANFEYVLHGIRMHKSDNEIKVMQTAANISANAHVKAMQACKPCMYEYQLEAVLDYNFKNAGAKFCAYNSIVASGANACILHYTDNNQQIKDGDLVLIDAGCEMDCYASDITRTFPANGKFSPAQLALYNIVLEANLAAIDAIKPEVSFNYIQQISVEVIVEGLLKLGILHGNKQQIIKDGSYKSFYMHKVGHWLGLDVHDVGFYKINKQWLELLRQRTDYADYSPFDEELGVKLYPNMVLTIEPGIYIAPNNQQVDAKWRGIGIRIEDDVVVTKDGSYVLTSNVPKHPHEIEKLMQG